MPRVPMSFCVMSVPSTVVKLLTAVLLRPRASAMLAALVRRASKAL